MGLTMRLIYNIGIGRIGAYYTVDIMVDLLCDEREKDKERQDFCTRKG